MNAIKILLIFFMLSSAGCSNKAVYENVRQNQKNACLKEPPAVYSECMERASKTYEQYQRERETLLNEDSEKSLEH